MYSLESLRNHWLEFFAKKMLYRHLMLSRAEGKYRTVYANFMHKFENAFKSG
jgi:hypothetical protein